MPKRLFFFLSILAAIAVVVVAVGTKVPGELPQLPLQKRETFQLDQQKDVSASFSTNTNAFIVHAVDGDTLLARLDAEPGDVRIRLLGINTPETVDPRKPVECFGKEASAIMHNLVDGKRVLLVADVQADERDKYDRLLRNVHLDDGTDVNAMMVRDGYAYAYLSFPLNPLRKRELKKMQEDAKLSGRGLWNPNTCNGRP